MRKNAVCLPVALSLALLFAACGNGGSGPGYTTPESLSQVLKSFDATSSDRSASHHSTTVKFEDLSYYVSTQEMRKVEADTWGYVMFGPSRESGYFVVPRMEWAGSITDVEEIIRADHRRGIGIPTAAIND